MTDPMDRMLARAMDRSESEAMNPERGAAVMRPGRHDTSFNDDLHLRERGDSEDLIAQIRDNQVDGLTPEHRDALLKELLKRNGNQVDRKRDIQMQGEALDLENKRKFSALALNLAKGAGIFIAFAVTAILCLLGYGVIFDKALLDSVIVNSFLTTFTEVFKALFSVF